MHEIVDWLLGTVTGSVLTYVTTDTVSGTVGEDEIPCHTRETLPRTGLTC